MADSITLYEYDLAGRPVGTALTSYDGFTTLATGRIKYNDGTGTVSNQYTTIYGDNGFADSEIEYIYTYYGLTTGVSPEAIYHYNANGAVYEYVYDSLGRVVERKTTVGAPADYTNPTQRLAYGFSESYDYVDISTVNNITTTTTLVQKYTDILGATHEYTYDANGNITSEEAYLGEKPNETDLYTINYTYDSQNRLTRCDDSNLGITTTYTYDNRGNILNYTIYDYTTGVVDESTADSYNYAYANATWKDLATTIMGESITYDAIGNPLKWQGHKRLTWANGRQLTRARASTFGTTFDVYYSYDGDGLRTGKSGTRNTEYIILGGTYIGERTTINGTEYLITYIYDANGSILGIDINGTAYYFVKNLQGDVTAMITEFGEIIGKYTYDAYGYCYPVKDASGNTITDETHPAMLNPFRYRGYYYDVETKFYYLNTRYYDPEACRFINADGQLNTNSISGYNMFSYCENSPANGCDPCGTCFHRLDFWNDCEMCGGKTIGDKYKEAVAVAEKAICTISTAAVILTDPINSLIKPVHYSRNVLNNDSYTEEELINQGYVKEESSSAKFHQNNKVNDSENRKYVIGEWFSSEVVYYSDGTINNTPEDRGTFNVYSGDNQFFNIVVHGLFDVVPYMLWGNSPDDTTTPIDRIIMIFE